MQFLKNIIKSIIKNIIKIFLKKDNNNAFLKNVFSAKLGVIKTENTDHENLNFIKIGLLTKKYYDFWVNYFLSEKKTGFTKEQREKIRLFVLKIHYWTCYKYWLFLHEINLKILPRQNFGFKAIGALTSKKFAFGARNWELNSSEGLDFTDSFMSNIRVDFRGSKIIRILPSINELLNEEWISDRIRYSFDGWVNQRLFFPYLLQKNKIIIVSWFYICLFLYWLHSFSFFNQLFSNYNFFLSNTLDLKSILTLKSFMNLNGSLDLKNISYLKDFKFKNIFNSFLPSLELIDFIFLININLRVNFPILNLKLRKIIVEHFIEGFNIGYSYNYSFFIKTVSNNIKILKQIIEGKHWINIFLQKSNNPFFLISNYFENLYSNFLNYILKYFLKYNNFFFFNWIGYNTIYKKINYNFNKYFFSKKKILKNFSIWKKKIILKKKYLYLIGYNLKKIKKKDYLIYQGHHADNITQFSKIIIPTNFFYERTGLYWNFEEKIQKQGKILFSKKNLWNDSIIFQVFMRFFFFFNFDNFFLLFYTSFFNYSFLLLEKQHRFSKLFFKFFFFKNFSYNPFLINTVLKTSRYLLFLNDEWKKELINFDFSLKN